MVGMVAPGQGRIKRRLVAMPPSVRGNDPLKVPAAIRLHPYAGEPARASQPPWGRLGAFCYHCVVEGQTTWRFQWQRYVTPMRSKKDCASSPAYRMEVAARAG